MTIKKAAEHIVKLANTHDGWYWCKEIFEFNKTLDYYTMRKANERALAILKGNR